MSKAPAPSLSLPPLRRVFDPARYHQQYFACAYRQLLPCPRRPSPAQAAMVPVGAAARPAAS
jgi:hypothetical protein